MGKVEEVNCQKCGWRSITYEEWEKKMIKLMEEYFKDVMGE